MECSIQKALAATLLATTFSALLGVVPISLSGLFWVIFSEPIVSYLLNAGTFNPISWFGTFFVAVLVNIDLEGFVYQKYFKFKGFYKTKLFAIFFIVNTIS